MVINEDDPDFIIFSVDYANQRESLKYKCPKIFYTGESVSANFDSDEPILMKNHAATYSIAKCDYAFTFDITSDPRHFRLPLWVLYIDWFKKGGYENPKFLLPLDKIQDNEYIRHPKTKFCAAIFSNPTPERISFIEKLNEYKKVDIYGKGFLPIEDGEKAKYEILKHYKFSICFENRVQTGYVTEKLFHALTTGTLPIYYGSKMDFSERCSINMTNYIPAASGRDYAKFFEYALANEVINYDLYPAISLNHEWRCDDNIKTTLDNFKPEKVLNFIEEKVL